MVNKNFRHRINYNIKSLSIRVFKDQQPLGIMTTDQAVKIAFDENLTLVELVSNANPPVCHIMDYGKYLYQEKIKDKEKLRKQRESVTLIKEIRLSPVISQHDIETKLKNAISFLEDQKKVQFNMQFKSRQIHTNKEGGMKIMQQIIDGCNIFGNVEYGPRFEGSKLICRITSKQI
jgi:translation initiation factor IF-3